MKQSSAEKLSTVGKYLWEQRLTDRDFADMMAKELGVPKFSPSTVENWRYGTRTPRGKNLIAVMALTGMTADQVLGVGAAA